MQQNWLNRAFNSYLTEGADLETELADAQQLSVDYQACVANIVVDDTAENSNQQYFQQMFQCATAVDPSFGQ